MASLRAHTLFHKDQHYVIQDGEIVIVDEFTGRLMSGRRWSDGLHQAVEAKEGVEIKRENQTLASITFQNYFRLYKKLSGMTGTADTEAFEFQSIYNLETVIIPTNRPIQRKDFNDQIFRSAEEKYEAVVKDIAECYKRGQPVLTVAPSVWPVSGLVEVAAVWLPNTSATARLSMPSLSSVPVPCRLIQPMLSGGKPAWFKAT